MPDPGEGEPLRVRIFLCPSNSLAGLRLDSNSERTMIRIAKELCKETCLVNHTDGHFAAPSMQGSNSNV